ncbi:dTDP-4-dehydrorhamnose 3,5-epimerase family protein [Amycolatopsis alba]|uniref:dTDP-4-keto-6-deoxy-D-glucose epimerase n=1 Tax=Amycolatopsis alba DSM 44262 TaxID=1125972 RepID=A0A229REY2_AMYAL|nr:dTDP-4-dehydrorhamnose 3,5-epimerase [Amycolatopsis alba]OXM45198.1 dTDP-4-keto-6-deoxy-D-glucose epimerase [Amycolatopsis alba DSM 44262]
MQSRKLAVEGAVEFTPQVFADDRGVFVSPLQEPSFVAAVGFPPFPLAQASCSRSKRGVVRGVHFTTTPPGCARYVHCPRGRALDYVVDIRVGSPTFGRWEAVVLDAESLRSVYFPVGVGHAFVALEEDTTMSYLMSASYVAENELAISVFDPELGLDIPDWVDPIRSARDLAAPTLAEAREKGLLPEYRECVRAENGFSR